MGHCIVIKQHAKMLRGAILLFVLVLPAVHLLPLYPYKMRLQGAFARGFPALCMDGSGRIRVWTVQRNKLKEASHYPMLRAFIYAQNKTLTTNCRYASGVGFESANPSAVVCQGG